MGNDGGSFVKRDSVKTAAPEHVRKAREVSSSDVKGGRLTSCALSGAPLSPPCVSDGAGNLFNKEALLAAFLAKDKKLAAFSIRKISRDVFTVRPTWVASGTGVGAGAGGGTAVEIERADTSSHALFVCPVSGVEGNGRHAFVAMRECGCVVSEKALLAVAGASACLACGVEFPAAAARNDALPPGAVRLAQVGSGAAVGVTTAARASEGKLEGVAATDAARGTAASDDVVDDEKERTTKRARAT